MCRDHRPALNEPGPFQVLHRSLLTAPAQVVLGVHPNITSADDAAGRRGVPARSVASLWKASLSCGRQETFVAGSCFDERGNCGAGQAWRADAAAASPAAAGYRSAPPPSLFGFGQFQVALGQFLDVDVLEGDDPYIFHKTGRPVHVPYPGIPHRDLEEDLAVVGGADVQLDLIGQVEPPL